MDTQFSRIIRAQLASTQAASGEKDNFEILELDELFTYCQKKPEKSMYGLLLIGTEMKLLILK